MQASKQPILTQITPYTGVASDEAKICSTSWEKKLCPWSRHHWITTQVVRYINMYIKTQLNEGFCVINMI